MSNQRVHSNPTNIWGYIDAREIASLWDETPSPIGRHYTVVTNSAGDFNSFLLCLVRHARKWTPESRACNSELPYCVSWKKNDESEVNVYKESGSQQGPYTYHIRLDPIGTATLKPNQEDGLPEYRLGEF